jgi:hypothetical protein
MDSWLLAERKKKFFVVVIIVANEKQWKRECMEEYYAHFVHLLSRCEWKKFHIYDEWWFNQKSMIRRISKCIYLLKIVVVCVNWCQKPKWRTLYMVLTVKNLPTFCIAEIYQNDVRPNSYAYFETILNIEYRIICLESFSFDVRVIESLVMSFCISSCHSRRPQRMSRGRLYSSCDAASQKPLSLENQ